MLIDIISCNSYYASVIRIVSVANHKGGTGKTATAHNLGAALAASGRRVLLVDTDPQGSLTGACGIQDAGEHSLAEVLGGSSPGRLAIGEVTQHVSPGLDLVPGDLALSTSELGLVSRLGRESVLKKALGQVAGKYDICLIDCPPSLGLLTVGALVASQGVIIPTQPLIQDLRGLRLFVDTVTQIRDELNPNLAILGILVTFYDGRLVHHRQAIEFIQAAGLQLMPVMIGRSVRVADAAGAGQAVITYEPMNIQAQNYQKLGEEVDRWLENPI